MNIVKVFNIYEILPLGNNSWPDSGLRYHFTCNSEEEALAIVVGFIASGKSFNEFTILPVWKAVYDDEEDEG